VVRAVGARRPDGQQPRRTARACARRAGFEAIGIELPSIYGPFGILLVFSLKFYPFVFLLTAGALGAINRSLEEAAESLGAGTWRRFFTVTLPLVFPAVTSGRALQRERGKNR